MMQTCSKKLCAVHWNAKVLIGCLISGLILNFMVVPIALAHDIRLVRSAPANGEVITDANSLNRVTAWFNTELEGGASWIMVYNAANERVDLGDGGIDLIDPEHASLLATLPTALPDGVYVVCWRAEVFDGDFAAGLFSFGINETPDPTTGYACPEENESSSSLSVLIGLGFVLVVGSVIFVVLTQRRGSPT
jgi:methionine-rich copper-binding protein CopC